MSQPKLTHVIRWTARTLSIVSIGVVLLFLAGEGFDITRIKMTEWVLFLFFPFGIFLGLILAWWKEGVGGAVTVASLAMFYGVHFVIASRFPDGWAFLAFTIPGFLFLLSWYRARTVDDNAAQPQ